MSFCIAKIIDNKIHIHTDSLLTGNDVVRHSLQKDSLIKAILINHSLCVSFAGNVSVAHDLISKINEVQPPSFQAFFNLVIEHHLRNDQCTDYIIASTFNNVPRLFEIKSGNFRDNLQTTWIGSKSAFGCFQEHFEQCKGVVGSLSSAFGNAFGKVLSDDRASDVGGFHISLGQYCVEKATGKPQILNYENRIHMYEQFDEEFKKRNGFWSTGFSNVGDGAFCYSVLPVMTFKHPGVVLYFGHIKLGLLYSHKQFGFKPKEFPNCNSLQFAKKLKKFGVKLKGNAYEADGGVVQILLGDE